MAWEDYTLSILNRLVSSETRRRMLDFAEKSTEINENSHLTKQQKLEAIDDLLQAKEITDEEKDRWHGLIMDDMKRILDIVVFFPKVDHVGCSYTYVNGRFVPIADIRVSRDQKDFKIWFYMCR